MSRVIICDRCGARAPVAIEARLPQGDYASKSVPGKMGTIVRFWGELAGGHLCPDCVHRALEKPLGEGL